MTWLKRFAVVGGWNLFLFAVWQIVFIPLWMFNHMCVAIDAPSPHSCDAAIYALEHPPSYWLALLVGNALLVFGYGVFRLVQRAERRAPALP